MSIAGSNGLLHTKSSYFFKNGGGAYGKGTQERKEYFKQSKINIEFNSAYEYAKKQEQQFYHSFFPEVNNYEEFIAKMRELFSKAEGDGSRIRGLANANLSKYVPTRDIQIQPDYQIVITGDISKKLPFEQLASETVSVESGGNLYIAVNSDSSTLVKEIMNSLAGKNRFHVDSPDLKRVKQLFSEMIGDKASQVIGNNIILTQSNSTTKNNVPIKGSLAFEIGGFPFQWKKTEIQKFLNGSYGPDAMKQFEKEMKEALSEIKNFIFNTCLHVEDGVSINGENILKKAAELTWNDIVGTGPLREQDFFFEGKNLAKSILGNGGEFQLALIDRYIHLATKNVNSSLGKIIGGIIKDNKRQPRSDYQLIIDLGGDVGNIILGIQIKNVNENSMQEIETKTDLDLVSPNLGQDFTDTIVNAYFNTDIKNSVGDMVSFLGKYLEKYFWKAMNLNIGEGLNPNHTNTFYWAGGTALVPSSEIINTLRDKENVTQPIFNIEEASFSSKSDKEFADDSNGDPPFTEYWYGNKSIEWVPLIPNAKIYSKLLNDTKIRTSFSMAEIFAINGGRGSFEIFS